MYIHHVYELLFCAMLLCVGAAVLGYVVTLVFKRDWWLSRWLIAVCHVPKDTWDSDEEDEDEYEEY